jgi:nitrite reductase (NADH) large subunit
LNLEIMEPKERRMTTYIIIGNGVAGTTAAEAIRKYDPEGRIQIFSREKYPFYYVPALPEYLAGEKQLNHVIIHDLSWYEKNRMELHLEEEVVRIDAAAKTVETKREARYPYDKILLATGGLSFIPPIKGAAAEGVLTLRTVDDANKIVEFAQKAKRVILIGGGLLGLEAGNGLRKRGLEIVVVEFFPRLLPRQMDVAGAAILQRQMEDMGFTFYLGAKTQEITREKDGLYVHLEAGEKIRGDMILISAGVRPDLTLARALGLEMDKGVKVDDDLKTSREDIYAAGDLIEHRGRFYGIWPAALEQGRVAGAAMAGEKVKYEGTVISNVLKVVGIDLFSAGEIDAEGKMEAVVRKDEAKGIYRKLVLENNAIIGAILLGDIRGSKEIQNAIKTRKDISPFIKELADEKFDFGRLD